MMKRSLQHIALLLTPFFLVACDWDSRADSEIPAYLHRVTVTPVQLQESYPVRREFAGQVQANQNPIVAFELPGSISEMLVNEGDAAEEGELLARLDTLLLDAERRELQAGSAEIESELALARRNLKRIERLESEQLASERERDELASRVRLLEASLRRNVASLEANSIRLEKSELRAPFKARIQERLADSGTVVAAGAPVFSLIEVGKREVRAGLPLHLASTLEVGDILRVRVGNETADASVIAIGAVVDQGTRSRPVRLAVSGDWSPGELAYLEIEEPETQTGTWLPATAVTEGLRGTWVAYVAVPRGDGVSVLEKRSLTVHHAEGDRLYVSGALRENDQVVTVGLHRVAPGQQVRAETLSVLSDARTDP